MATYEQVKDVPNQPEIYLIDVRNEDEIAETGSIPASLNIPCTQASNLCDRQTDKIIVFPVPKLESALKSEAEEFKEAYGREKPAEDADIIFTCRSGRRVVEAEEIAKNAGFTK